HRHLRSAAAVNRTVLSKTPALCRLFYRVEVRFDPVLEASLDGTCFSLCRSFSCMVSRRRGGLCGQRLIAKHCDGQVSVMGGWQSPMVRAGEPVLSSSVDG